MKLIMCSTYVTWRFVQLLILWFLFVLSRKSVFSLLGVVRDIRKHVVTIFIHGTSESHRRTIVKPFLYNESSSYVERLEISLCLLQLDFLLMNFTFFLYFEIMGEYFLFIENLKSIVNFLLLNFEIWLIFFMPFWNLM